MGSWSSCSRWTSRATTKRRSSASACTGRSTGSVRRLRLPPRSRPQRVHASAACGPRPGFAVTIVAEVAVDEGRRQLDAVRRLVSGSVAQGSRRACSVGLRGARHDRARRERGMLGLPTRLSTRRARCAGSRCQPCARCASRRGEIRPLETRAVVTNVGRADVQRARRCSPRRTRSTGAATLSGRRVSSRFRSGCARSGSSRRRRAARADRRGRGRGAPPARRIKKRGNDCRNYSKAPALSPLRARSCGRARSRRHLHLRVERGPSTLSPRSSARADIGRSAWCIRTALISRLSGCSR